MMPSVWSPLLHTKSSPLLADSTALRLGSKSSVDIKNNKMISGGTSRCSARFQVCPPGLRDLWRLSIGTERRGLAVSSRFIAEAFMENSPKSNSGFRDGLLLNVPERQLH